MKWVFPEVDRSRLEVLEVYSDSDWASCIKTRKSTTAGLVVFGGATLKSWSTTQKVIARSSGEAELYALIRGASEGLGVQALACEMGVQVGVHVLTDSSAAVGTASRQGLGEVRHLSVSDLWVQECVRQGRFAITKIPGHRNPADAMSKVMSAGDIAQKLYIVGARLKACERPRAIQELLAVGGAPQHALL